ncbi:MAG: hypothetical protein FJ150_02815 [Euryarchaeota archaeon]|nr:hypothetical protein [Euryarchaeota archaeon]
MRKLWIILILIIVFTPIAIYAWNDCPYGLINDPYPGQCPRYTDTNNDGLCDHSQSPPQTEDTTTNTTETGGKGKRKVQDNNQTTTVNTVQEKPAITTNYYLIPLTIFLVLLYISSYLLYKNKKINVRTHKKIWNLILTVGYLATGITGIFLILVVNYGIQLSVNLTINFWHAEFAIIMTVTTILHIHVYWRPFKKIFRGIYS